jgi:adenosylmethionine-8-amino-7-oxononanoate aminotransferase
MHGYIQRKINARKKKQKNEVKFTHVDELMHEQSTVQLV